jgi:hypothetical protein
MVGANAARFPARRTFPPKADLTKEEAMIQLIENHGQLRRSRVDVIKRFSELQVQNSDVIAIDAPRPTLMHLPQAETWHFESIFQVMQHTYPW